MCVQWCLLAVCGGGWPAPHHHAHRMPNVASLVSASSVNWNSFVCSGRISGESLNNILWLMMMMVVVCCPKGGECWAYLGVRERGGLQIAMQRHETLLLWTLDEFCSHWTHSFEHYMHSASIERIHLALESSKLAVICLIRALNAPFQVLNVHFMHWTPSFCITINPIVCSRYQTSIKSTLLSIERIHSPP